MKTLSLILWVTQFGLSILVPPCFLLWVAVALRSRYGLGMWIIAVLGILGLMTGYYLGSSTGAAISLLLALLFAVSFCMRKRGA